MDQIFTEGLGERFSEALVGAARLHAAQVRKGTRIPYVAHVLGVTAIALEHGATEDEAIAAVLHDVIENVPKELGAAWARSWIRYRFGQPVLDIVEGCRGRSLEGSPLDHDITQHRLARGRHDPFGSARRRFIEVDEYLNGATGPRHRAQERPVRRDPTLTVWRRDPRGNPSRMARTAAASKPISPSVTTTTCRGTSPTERADRFLDRRNQFSTAACLQPFDPRGRFAPLGGGAENGLLLVTDLA